jgi:transposase
MRDYRSIDHCLAVEEGSRHGRLHRALRRLDSFGGQTAHRISTPLVPGRAEVATELCGGHARQAEQRFGWGRDTVEKGLHELRHGVRCLENFAARGRQRSEQKDQQLAADIRAIVEPHTHADPELKSSRRYTNLSAAEVRQALINQGYSEEGLPAERTMRDILNRRNYRLQRIQKGKPLKKTDETNAIFANVAAVRAQARDEPETLKISRDTKAKVGLGEYARGGKNPNGRRR